MEPATDHSESRRASLRALLRVVDIPLIACLAIATYFALAYTLVDRLRLMPTGHSRLLNSKELLEQRHAAQHRDVYILGSSVVIDGIDCNLVDKQLPQGVESFSIDGIGSGPGRWPFVEPSLERAEPAMVVLIVDLASALADVPMPWHVAAVAGWFDFLPRDSRASVENVLDQEKEVNYLFAPRYEQLLAFRVLPLVHLDVTLRETMRKDLRYEGYASNFKDPWIRKARVSEAAMERSVRQTVEQLSRYSAQDLDRTNLLVKRVADRVRPVKGQVLVVFAPMNPAVIEQLSPGYLPAMSAALAAGAAAAGAIYVDQSTLLPASDFSDHCHPFEAGREKWSAELGKAIRAALEEAKQPHAVSDT